MSALVNWLMISRVAQIARLGLLAGLSGLVGQPASAWAQEAVTSIETPGRAELQVCRSWVLFRSCNQYSRVDIPSRVAVGDQLFLEFGSNPKSMTFPVGAIRRAEDACTIYTGPPPSGDDDEVDKLTVAPCRKSG
jgi:hypothetical protein